MATLSPRSFSFAFGGIALCVAAMLAPLAAVVFVTNAGVSFAIVFAGLGLGQMIAAALRFETPTTATRYVVATALGMGALSLLVLGLGMAGVMNRGIWIAIIAALDGIAIWMAVRQYRTASTLDGAAETSSSMMRWIALLPALFLAFGILAAAMPPGILWPAEGSGYDVLEYHLGAPRDYFDAGRIAYLPDNIYSNFPFNVEMLYLLSMMLHGDPVRAVYTAKILNLLLGVLAVLAIWRAGARVSGDTGIAAAVLAGCVPFLVYLSGVAYVENGMLFFASAAMLVALGLRDRSDGVLRPSLIAGLLAGFAAGCKYTALPMIAAPLVVFAVIEAFRSKTSRVSPLVMLFGTILALAPWLTKNLVATGNPVFPLASRWFGYSDDVWDSGAEKRWIDGHQPQEAESTLRHRLTKLTDQLLISNQFGPIVPLGLASIIGLTCLDVIRRRRLKADASAAGARQLVVASGVIAAIALYVWMFHTHLVDRFAIVLIAPCALASAAMLIRVLNGRRVLFAAILLVVIALCNVWHTWRLFSNDRVSYLSLNAFGCTDCLIAGESPVYPHVHTINQLLAAGGHVLVVGDAKSFYLDDGADCCVVFNRNSFADAAADPSVDVVDWLRTHGYSHVYLDWFEMNRLRSTYGFWPSITPELFEHLHLAGLRPVRSFYYEPGTRPYATLFAVPIAPGATTSGTDSSRRERPRSATP